MLGLKYTRPQKALSVTALIVMTLFAFACNFQKNNKQENNIIAVLSLSGSAATIGIKFKQGIDMYLEENPQSTIALEIQDSKSKPSDAVAAFSQAISLNTPQAVITTSSSVSGAIIPKAEEEGLFSILSLSASPSVLSGRLLTQRLNYCVSDITEPIARYAKVHFKNVGVLYSNEEYGMSSHDVFKNAFTDEAHAIVYSDSYSLTDPSTAQTLALKLIQVNPDAAFITGFGPTYVEIIKTMKSLGFANTILTDINGGDPSNLETWGSSCEGLVFSGTELELTEPRSPEVREFAQKYREKFGMSPYCPTAISYEIMSILDKLLLSGKPLSQATFQDMGRWNGPYLSFQFLPGGECHMSTIIIKRQGGQNVPVE